MNAIEIRHLEKQQGAYFKLNCEELILPGGCIMGLIGKNGAGKSTLIRLLLGMIRKDGGEISLLERGNIPHDRAILEDVGVVLDTTMGIPGKMNAVQVGKLMRGLYRNWNREKYETYLTRFEIPRRTRFEQLSRGMRVKLNLAVALSHDAKLLILDEATNGLDALMRDEVIDILMEFTRSEEHSVLISSHMIGDLEKVCDYVAFLRCGELTMCEEKDRLLDRYGMIQTTAEALDCLPEGTIFARKETAFGAQAIVLRERMPQDMTVIPVTLEELFIAMEKEEMAS